MKHLNPFIELPKYYIIKYSKGNAKFISLFEISKSRKHFRTHITHYIGVNFFSGKKCEDHSITYKQGDVLYEFFKITDLLDEHDILYETTDINDAKEKFYILIETNKYNL